MNNNLTGIVEVAAIGHGIAVKKGTAANGVVIASAQAACRGLAVLTDFTDTAAVGEQLSIQASGLGMAVVSASVTAGADVTTDANGKIVPISGVTPAIGISGASVDITPSGTSIGFVNRLGIAEETGYPGELIKITVTRDQVAVIVA